MPLRRLPLFILFLAVLVACTQDPAFVDVPPRAQPQSRAELEYARATLNSIQEQSIARNREYCGYIGVDSFGRFLATTPVRGRESRCRPKSPRGDFLVLASYHSHGGFSEVYDSEVPSYEDLTTDILEEIDGYVATPGGRMWYVDARRKEARLVCGPNCLLSDPAYRDEVLDPLRTRYTLEDLARRSGA